MSDSQVAAQSFGRFAERVRVEIEPRNARTRASVDRYLLIVSGNQPDLCENLRRALSGDRKVQVLLDRRCGERRQQLGPRKPERRRTQRRRQAGTLSRSDWFVVTA